MVYGQVPPPGPRQPGKGGAVAVGVLLLAQLLLELVVLAYDVTQAGPAYLLDAAGFSYEHYVVAPTSFFGYDAALCVALVVLAVAAFRGSAWAKPAATVLLAVNAYASSTALISLLTGGGTPAAAETPGQLALLAVPALTLLLAVAVGVVTGVTRAVGPAQPGYFPPPYAGYAPYPQPAAFPHQHQQPQQHPLPPPPVLPQPPSTPPTV
ncbi:hypothetical protein [Kitasatospora terrestris]|uniref:Integral membrane protein n=1 Tax=Kitasatospora terrestris TaxID=258051 RepID=A0ABP9DKC5_9ACTN